MKWPLFEYQQDAAVHVLTQMSKARRRFHEEAEKSSFALTATTGAGKTVIAAAVIEALFQGSTDLGFDEDPTAVVLWVTDDESLNNQTMHNMIRASDLDVAQLEPINNEDFPLVLARHRVYFLNVQKLYDSSTRFTEPTDLRSYTLWDTVRNTIEEVDTTLYLVLDEAHKGMKKSPNRATTVQRLVNGSNDVPSMPIVWGISATTERFIAAMKEAKDRTELPHAVVPIAEVQASGLLKDAIILNNPDEPGQFDTTLLREAVHQVKTQGERWNSYCRAEGIEPILPLLVVQVENKPSQAELARIVSVIAQEWRDLSATAIANVFGEHADFTVGSRNIRYVAPENVQDDTGIRVLLAKDAVTTGWDCPRAEVLFSMRGAQDKTYITQFMGRMVRTPLARRITSDELLNTVVCLLPKFRRATTTEIANRLSRSEFDENGKDSEGNGSRTGLGMRVFRKPVELTRNPHVENGVFDLISRLPSEPKPSPLAKPIPRMFEMATALAGDGLLRGAIDAAMLHIYGVMDGLMAQHAATIASLKSDIQTAEIATIKIEFGKDEIEHGQRKLSSDARTVDDAFASASRVLTKAIANGYQLHRASQLVADDGEEDLYEAKLDVAALAALEDVVAALNHAANALVNDWLAQYNTDIKHLTEGRQAEYNRILLQSSTPVQRDTTIPTTRLEESVDNELQAYPTRPLHLLADVDGNFPIGALNDWEVVVLDKELARANVLGWYRNPSNATESSIQIPYQAGSKWSTVQPDFILFSRNADGKVCASIVDPHGGHLADALDKLKGLAKFAERHSDGAYLRIESIDKNSAGELVKLDLMQKAVRGAVALADRVIDLFNGPHAMKFT